MKVLFVSGSNRELSSVVEDQAASLSDVGIEVEHYLIQGKGGLGYILNIPLLRKKIATNNYDLIHAHFSHSGVTASLSTIGLKKKVITSLMGSDVNRNFRIRMLSKFFSVFIWHLVIVKSEDMKRTLGYNKAKVLPNGVNFSIFRPLDKEICKKKVEFNSKYNIIFVAHTPERKVKNLPLARNAFKFLNNDEVKLHIISYLNRREIPIYMSAADVLILTSFSEGSPNVIKEAMACGCPIVSTNVGDVESVIGKTKGCYLSSFDPMEFKSKMELALKHEGRTTGRDDIKHLDSRVIANQLKKIYQSV